MDPQRMMLLMNLYKARQDQSGEKNLPGGRSGYKNPDYEPNNPMTDTQKMGALGGMGAGMQIARGLGGKGLAPLALGALAGGGMGMTAAPLIKKWMS